MRSFTDRLAEFFNKFSGPKIHPILDNLVDGNPIHLSCKFGPTTHPILFFLNIFLNHIHRITLYIRLLVVLGNGTMFLALKAIFTTQLLFICSVLQCFCCLCCFYFDLLLLSNLILLSQSSTNHII